MEDISTELAKYKLELDNKINRLNQIFALQSIRVDVIEESHVCLLKELWDNLVVYKAPTDPVDPDYFVPEFQTESKLWIQNGFQTKNPCGDFRGGGQLALQNLAYFAKNFTPQANTFKAHGQYPFSLAGLNITRMLLDLLCFTSHNNTFEPTKLASTPFWKLADDPEAFNKLYCMAFMLLDLNWTETHASAMDFNRVLGEIKTSMSLLVRKNPENVDSMWKLWLDARAAIKEEWSNKTISSRRNSSDDTPKSGGERRKSSFSDASSDTGRRKSSVDDASMPVLPVAASLLKKQVEDLPTMIGESIILKKEDITFLKNKLPLHFRGCDWNLVFNVKQHGFSIESFYEVKGCKLCLLLKISIFVFTCIACKYFRRIFISDQGQRWQNFWWFCHRCVASKVSVLWKWGVFFILIEP
jgi:hypothetical protein